MAGDLRQGWSIEYFIRCSDTFIEVHNDTTFNEVVNVSGNKYKSLKRFRSCLGVWKVKGSESQLPINKQRYN